MSVGLIPIQTQGKPLFRLLQIATGSAIADRDVSRWSTLWLFAEKRILIGLY
jgi:hypothetical protein